MGLCNFGKLGFCGTLGRSDFRIFERLIVWILGLWDLSAIGVLDFRIVALLSFGTWGLSMWQLLWDFETYGFGTLKFFDFEMFELFGVAFVVTLERWVFLILSHNNSVFGPHLWMFDFGVSGLWDF